MFTVNWLDLPGALRRCLSSTNPINCERQRRASQDAPRDVLAKRPDGPPLGGRRIRRTGFVETEKNYRRIMEYQQLWMLKAALD